MLIKIVQFIKQFPIWLKHRIHHKLEHFSLKKLKKIVVKGGMSLLLITLGWEIIEDVLFPVIFMTLGSCVHPVFYAAVPVSWALCLHWLAVPVLWGLWVKYRKTGDKKDMNIDL